MNRQTGLFVRIISTAVLTLLTLVPLTAQDGRGQPANLRKPGPIRRMSDGKPDLTGYWLANAGGANYGLERHEQDFLTPATRGVIVDPPDGKLPYQDWARAEGIERELPHRGYDDPTAHCFVPGVAAFDVYAVAVPDPSASGLHHYAV